MSKRISIIKGGEVINQAAVPDGWTGKRGEWKPPVGHTTSAAAGAVIGARLQNGKWRRPEPDTTPRPKTRLERLEDLLVAEGFINREDLS